MSWGVSSLSHTRFSGRHPLRGLEEGSIIHTFEFPDDDDRAPEDVRIEYTIVRGEDAIPSMFEPGSGHEVNFDIPDGYSMSDEERTALEERIADSHQFGGDYGDEDDRDCDRDNCEYEYNDY